MAHNIVKSSLPLHEKGFHRIFEEIATITGTAFETSASTVRLILFYVFADTRILSRSRTEIIQTTAGALEPQ